MANPIVKRIFPFLSWWSLVNKASLKSDFIAGLTGALIVLPQGMAFALIAGLPPIYGLYTAMMTPIIAALFGSSYHLVSGPTTTISITVLAVVGAFAQPQTEEFISLALTLTIIVGIIQFVLGVVRLGVLVNFVSRTVVTGYTAGAALLIITSQIKYILGIDLPAGSSFVHSWQFVFQNSAQISAVSVIVGGVTIVVAVLIKKWLPKIPHLLFVMILGIGFVYSFNQYLGDIAVVGVLPSGLPSFRIPSFDFKIWNSLASGAFAVAALGLIEVVSISRSIASKSKQRLDSNQEFIGLGLSNIVGGFFSCYAGSGSFTRSGLNYSSGAKTPMAAIFSACLLVLIVLLISPLAGYIPMATMGGIIMLVAFYLIDWSHIRHLMRTSKSETTVMTIVFLSCLLFGMVFAIFAGIIFSLAFYLMKTTRPKVVFLAPRLLDGERKFMNVELHELNECPQLHVVRIDGSLFFGATENIRNLLQKLSETKKYILLIGNGINFIDVAGAELLCSEAERLKAEGGGLYFSHLKKSVRDFMDKGYHQKIGSEYFFYGKEKAISEIYQKLDRSVCDTCTFRIFKECEKNPE